MERHRCSDGSSSSWQPAYAEHVNLPVFDMTTLVLVLQQILESNSLHELGLWLAGYIGSFLGSTHFWKKHQSNFLYLYTLSQLCSSFKVNIGSDLWINEMHMHLCCTYYGNLMSWLWILEAVKHGMMMQGTATLSSSSILSPFLSTLHIKFGQSQSKQSLTKFISLPCILGHILTMILTNEI